MEQMQKIPGKERESTGRWESTVVAIILWT
jgi:hypothetical protein